MLSGMVERSSRHSEAQDPGPQAWCVCGEKVTIADAREVTLPNGRPGWEGYCPECGGPLFGIRRNRRTADAPQLACGVRAPVGRPQLLGDAVQEPRGQT